MVRVGILNQVSGHSLESFESTELFDSDRRSWTELCHMSRDRDQDSAFQQAQYYIFEY